MTETERRKQNISEQPRLQLKFRTIRNECLPYLKPQPNSLPTLDFHKFIKKEIPSNWKNQAEMKKEIRILKEEQSRSRQSQIMRLKQHLRNQTSALKLKKKYLQKRLEANLLIKVAMREISNKQERLLNSSNHTIEAT